METNEANYINDSQTVRPTSANYMHVCIELECKSCGHKGWDTEFRKTAFFEYKPSCSVVIHHFICPQCGSIDNYNCAEGERLENQGLI